MLESIKAYLNSLIYGLISCLSIYELIISHVVQNMKNAPNIYLIQLDINYVE